MFHIYMCVCFKVNNENPERAGIIHKMLNHSLNKLLTAYTLRIHVYAREVDIKS